MAGSRKTGAILQERDRQLLSALATLRIVDRKQAQVVAGFSSITRANWRLLRLVRAGYLRRVFMPAGRVGQKAIYALSRQGALLVGGVGPCLPLRAGHGASLSPLLLHQLAINELYLKICHEPLPPGWRLARWLSFRKPLSERLPLIPDGYFQIENGSLVRPHFVEVDLGSETPSIIAEKAERYVQLALSGEFPARFGPRQFRVLLITTTERRLLSLTSVVAHKTDKLFFLTTFGRLEHAGLWAAIWQRPVGSGPHALL